MTLVLFYLDKWAVLEVKEVNEVGRALKIAQNKGVHTMGLLIIVLFKCSFKKLSLNFRAQNRREGNFSTICPAAACFLSTPCRMIKEEARDTQYQACRMLALNTLA